jgi:hypothetical protein
VPFLFNFWTVYDLGGITRKPAIAARFKDL